MACTKPEGDSLILATVCKKEHNNLGVSDFSIEFVCQLAFVAFDSNTVFYVVKSTNS